MGEEVPSNFSTNLASQSETSPANFRHRDHRHDATYFIFLSLKNSFSKEVVVAVAIFVEVK